MREKVKQAIQAALGVLAHFAVRRHRPFVIGVTGSVGKTSAKEAIYAVVRARGPARESTGNLNNEFGLPLAILGVTSGGRGVWFWFRALSRGVQELFRKRRDAEVFVLEYGADKPNDLKYLLEIARPSIAVVTAIGEIPAHIEFYPDRDALVREKTRLVEAPGEGGFAILNADDETVLGMRGSTRARVITFGWSTDADIRISNFETRFAEGKPTGMSCKLSYGGSTVPLRIAGAFGRPQAYAAAAGAGVGIALGMNLVKIVEALAEYRAPAHRLEVVAGIRGSTVIDDAYNASPLSVHAALELFREIPARRKIAVLGDMLEIGAYALAAHEALGREVARVAHVLVAIGPRAAFISQGALSAGLATHSIFSFPEAVDAVGALEDLIQEGDLVLIKGSLGVNLLPLVSGLRKR